MKGTGRMGNSTANRAVSIGDCSAIIDRESGRCSEWSDRAQLRSLQGSRRSRHETSCAEFQFTKVMFCIRQHPRRILNTPRRKVGRAKSGSFVFRLFGVFRGSSRTDQAALHYFATTCMASHETAPGGDLC